MGEAVVSAVLFDVGGVLIKTPFEMIDYHRSSWSIDVPWRGPFDPQTDPLFATVAAGHMTERDYWAARMTELAPVLGRSGPEENMAALFDAPEEIVIRWEMIELIDDLRDAGLRLGLLTNDLGKFHGADWADDLPALTAVGAIVDLSETTTLKPHPAAYRLGVAAVGGNANEVLLVDDQPANIAGAAAAGLQTVLFDVVEPRRSIGAIRAAVGLGV